MNIFRAKRKGQSLLETIIAISILVVGTVSMLGMVYAMLVARTAAEYETVATNLAREGIEVVRNVRDTNWLKGNSFDAGLYATTSGYDYSAGASFDPAANTWSLFFDPATVDSAAARVYQYASGPYQGLYTQSALATPPSPLAPTMFSRLIETNPISDGGIVIPEPEANWFGTTTGIRVRSTVKWTERGRPHTVVVEERIYDWR